MNGQSKTIVDYYVYTRLHSSRSLVSRQGRNKGRHSFSTSFIVNHLYSPSIQSVVAADVRLLRNSLQFPETVNCQEEVIRIESTNDKLLKLIDVRINLHERKGKRTIGMK